MTLEYEETIAFVTQKGVSYYKVMLFGLKNARATYKRLKSNLYDGLIGKIIEAYINNTVVKSLDFSSHFGSS